jgi:alpha-galactosidase/6-phospho-beta-glucosidase family protein
MSTAISIIGAGGFRWGPLNIRDILLDPMLAGSTVTLWDLDDTALDLVYEYGCFAASCAPFGSRVRRARSEDEALSGQDVILLTLNVGGLELMRKEIDWTQRCGLVQPVGDTTGPAGFSRALRHLPVILALAEKAQQTSPDALLLNTTNPLTLLNQALASRCDLPVIGVCHEPHHVLNSLKGLFNLDDDSEINYILTGQNHCSWLFDLSIGNRLLVSRWCEAGGTVSTEPVKPDLPAPALQESQAVWHAMRRLYRLSHGHEPEERQEAELYALFLNFYVFSRTGYFPACRPRHFAEFYKNWITPETQWGQLLGVPTSTVRSRILYRQAQRALVVGALEKRDGSDLVLSEREIVPVIRSTVCDAGESLFVNRSSGAYSCIPQFIHEYRVPVRQSSLMAPPELPHALRSMHRFIHQQYQDWIDATLQQDENLMLQVLERDPSAHHIKDKDHYLQGILWLNQPVGRPCAA